MAHRGVSNGNNNRGKPYGLMLVLAFGAALLGVMVIHKLRERRIFNLLVKEKDQQLNSLHFLLQKEREYTKELKSKNEEMKAKIYSLRTQKMELDRRILEIQSAIDSLKDEHKTMESTLEEKQNEIKVLRDANSDAEKGTIQVITLMESLKQKDAEIEDLKQRLNKPLKIWSVSSDDPSNPTTVTNINKLDDSQSKEVVDHLQKSNSYDDGANSTTANAIETMSTMLKNTDNNTEATKVKRSRMGIIDGTEVSRELESQKTENSVETIKHESTHGNKTIENVEEGRKENSQGNSALGKGDQEKNYSNVTLNNVTELPKAGDARGNVKSGVNEVERKINIDDQLGDEHSQQEILDYQKTFGGGLKMEVMENTRTYSKEKMKNLRVSKATGKRWRTMSRNRLLENSRNLRRNSFVTMKNRKFDAERQQGLDRKEAIASNHLLQPTNVVDSSTTKSLEPQNSDHINKQGDVNQPRAIQRASGKLMIYPNSKVLRSRTVEGEPKNSRTNAKKQRLNEVQQQEDEEAGDIPEHINSRRNMSTMNGNAEKKIPVRRAEEIEGVDRENERDETRADSYREADLEENIKYKEETDESEF